MATEVITSDCKTSEKRAIETLRRHESDIVHSVSQLSNVAMDLLVKDLSRADIISKDVDQVLRESGHNELLPRLDSTGKAKLIYFVISKRLEEKRSFCIHEFFELLSRKDRAEELSDRLKQTYRQILDRAIPLHTSGSSQKRRREIVIGDTRPVLHQLQLLKHQSSSISTIERVATKWKDVALGLHFEQHYILILETNYQHQVVEACRTMFTRWLEGYGRKPTTWRTLITALKEAQLNILAEELGSAFDISATGYNQALQGSSSNIELEDWPSSKRHEVLPQFDEECSIVMTLFNQVVDKAIKSIKDADKLVQFRYFVIGMDKLSQEQVAQVKNATNVETIFEILSQIRFISFLELQNLPKIINEFCKDKCAPDMEKYIETLKSFMEKRTVPTPYCEKHCNHHSSSIGFCVHIDPKHQYFCDFDISELTNLIADIVHRRAIDLLIHKI